jgi:hypothetical protein
MARLSLYHYGKWVVEQGFDQLGADEIDEEIRAMRRNRMRA